MSSESTVEDYRSQPDNKDLGHIPGSDGLPYIGRMYEILTNYIATVEEHHQKWGNISRVKMLPNPGVMVLGADNFQHIMLNRDQNFSNEMGFKETLGVFYSGGLLLQDGTEHKIQRRLLQTAFKNDAMKTYVDRMSPIMARHISEWDSQIEFFPKIKSALLEVGSSVFIGIEDKAVAQKFNKSFVHINEGLLGVVRKEWSITAYGRGQKAKRYALGAMKDMIPQRRGTDMRDILTYMTNEKTEDDMYFSDDIICKQALFLLFAAHDTTSSALNHIMYYTAKNPQWQEKMREEVLAMDADQLSYDRLDELPTMDLVFDEALRLHPAVPMSMRRTINECEIEGHRIPANTVLFMPAPFNQRDPQYWTNPNDFDPMRFTAGREEHKGHAFCYHPFGGGAHKCIGMHFARMLVKTFMFELLKGHKYSLPENFEVKFQWMPLPRPKKLPIKLEALS